MRSLLQDGAPHFFLLVPKPHENIQSVVRYIYHITINHRIQPLFKGNSENMVPQVEWILFDLLPMENLKGLGYIPIFRQYGGFHFSRIFKKKVIIICWGGFPMVWGTPFKRLRRGQLHLHVSPGELGGRGGRRPRPRPDAETLGIWAFPARHGSSPSNL